ITGASSGLGAHAARLYAGKGARVTICARRTDRISELARAISDEGGKAQAIALDVTDSRAIDHAIETAQRDFGLTDTLINNAGVAGHDMIADMDESEWDRIFDTNLKGAWLCARAVAKALIAANRGGIIVNIASVLGYVVQRGTGPYAASKAGLIQLTKAMALEWARNDIRVNAVAPGYFATEMTDEFLASAGGQKFLARVPMRRAGTMDDLSDVLLLLAGDGSRYMTGSVITVDGGAALASL
ncbi:MAG: SDR family oxidoreductase, partial [Rhodobacteraceae bacterium]|nr:SDR family oxidoreductase [Paracoccaceae bacterium]